MDNSFEQPPKLTLASKASNGSALADEFISAFRVAVREAQARHFAAGDSIVIARDGQIVYIDPPAEAATEDATPLAA